MVPLQGSTMQLIMGAVTALIFLLLQVQANPLRDMADDYLASFCSFSLVVTFVCAIVFKEAMLIDLPDIQAKMSLEQVEVYAIDHGVLSFVLMASVFGAIGVSAVLFSVQLVHEGRRLRQEARAAKVRRLRYLQTDEEVTVPKLDLATFEWATSRGILPWHLFLSHNWAQGQSDMRVIKQRLSEMMPDVRVFLDVDNLGSGVLNSTHIDISGLVLCFCTSRFFVSGPCAQEIVRSVLQDVPMFTLLEPDALAGGMSEDECRDVFRSNPQWTTEAKPRIGKIGAKLDQWRVAWNKPELQMPTSAQCEAALFAQAPLIWSRLSAFQDVSYAAARTLAVWDVCTSLFAHKPAF